jgi:hypothetical protein
MENPVVQRKQQQQQLRTVSDLGRALVLGDDIGRSQVELLLLLHLLIRHREARSRSPESMRNGKKGREENETKRGGEGKEGRGRSQGCYGAGEARKGDGLGDGAKGAREGRWRWEECEGSEGATQVHWRTWSGAALLVRVYGPKPYGELVIHLHPWLDGWDVVRSAMGIGSPCHVTTQPYPISWFKLGISLVYIFALGN